MVGCGMARCLIFAISDNRAGALVESGAGAGCGPGGLSGRSFAGPAVAFDEGAALFCGPGSWLYAGCGHFGRSVPEGLRVNPRWAPVLILLGYCGVHLLEHTLVPHFHFGDETHHLEFISAKTCYSVLLGLATHCFFDGVAIGSGFVLSHWLGWVLFFAVFLHKIPEGFTVASVMMATVEKPSDMPKASLFYWCI